MYNALNKLSEYIYFYTILHTLLLLVFKTILNGPMRRRKFYSAVPWSVLVHLSQESMIMIQ